MRIHFQLRYYPARDKYTFYNGVIDSSRFLLFILSSFIVHLERKRINWKKKKNSINNLFFVLNIFWLAKQVSDFVME